MLSVHLLQRDFTELGMPAGLAVEVERMSWAAVGGPDGCRLTFHGEAGQLWELAEMLRCPVEVRNESQELVWWGYVDRASVQSGRLRASVSLGEMANSVRVLYSHLQPGTGLAGSRVLSGAAEDAESIAEYGRKELQHPVGGMNSDQAAALREKLLQARRWPVASVEVEAETGEAAALDCLGWWHLLDWSYYAQPAGREQQELGGVQHWMGAQAADWQLAQSFSLVSPTAWWAERVWVKVKTIGAPADNLYVDLCEDVGGNPGATLARATLPGPEIGVSTMLRLFDLGLSDRVALQPGVTYWLKASRSGAIDGMNYYELDLTESGAAYPRGNLNIWNGANWAARAPASDLYFRILGSLETTGQIAAMLATQPLFTGLDLAYGSYVYSCQYRLGDHKTRTEIESLLAAGSSAGRRLLASVDGNRRVQVRGLAVPGEWDWTLLKDGTILDEHDRWVDPCRGLAGVWVRLRDLTPGSADITKLGDLARVWVESSEWVGKTGRLRIQSQKMGSLAV